MTLATARQRVQPWVSRWRSLRRVIVKPRAGVATAPDFSNDIGRGRDRAAMYADAYAPGDVVEVNRTGNGNRNV